MKLLFVQQRKHTEFIDFTIFQKAKLALLIFLQNNPGKMWIFCH